MKRLNPLAIVLHLLSFMLIAFLIFGGQSQQDATHNIRIALKNRRQVFLSAGQAELLGLLGVLFAITAVYLAIDAKRKFAAKRRSVPD